MLSECAFDCKWLKWPVGGGSVVLVWQLSTRCQHHRPSEGLEEDHLSPSLYLPDLETEAAAGRQDGKIAGTGHGTWIMGQQWSQTFVKGHNIHIGNRPTFFLNSGYHWSLIQVISVIMLSWLVSDFNEHWTLKVFGVLDSICDLGNRSFFLHILEQM